MPTHADPPSAERLQRAMDRAGLGSRANPRAKATPPPSVVEVQYPDGGSPWHPHDSFQDFADARDEIGAMVDPRDGRRYPAGTAVRIAQGEKTAWLGVSNGADIVEAPPMPPVPRGYPRDWATAWDTDRAQAPWMLRQCFGVRRPLVVLATIGCIRDALELLPPGEDRPRVALEACDRWARGEMEMAKAMERIMPATASRLTGQPETVFGVGLAVTLLTHVMREPMGGPKPPAAWASDASVATARVWEGVGPGGTARYDRYLKSRLRQARSVRFEVPLGVVLLGLLEAPS